MHGHQTVTNFIYTPSKSLPLAFHEDEVDDDPGGHQAEEVPVADAAHVLDAGGGVERRPEPEVLRLARVLALGHRHVVLGEGAGGPGQGELRRTRYYLLLHNQEKGVSMLSRGLATLLHNDMRQTPD